jgi:flagellar hook-length control protein FliK
MTAISAPPLSAPTAAPARASSAATSAPKQNAGRGFAAALDGACARAAAGDAAAAESATSPAPKDDASDADTTAAPAVAFDATAIPSAPAAPSVAPPTAPVTPPTLAAAAADEAAAALTAVDAATGAASTQPTPGAAAQGIRRDDRRGSHAPPDTAADVAAVDRRDAGPRSSMAHQPLAVAQPAAVAVVDRGIQTPGDNASLTAPTPGLVLRELAPAHAGPTSPSAPFTAHLSAALDSPAFAPALATQVKWLVREGVQQAQLTLNPPEMGPLAVHIVLDGVQARIDFRADLAATRSAIEASLPTLAAALGENGLTMTGGGVFDGQARHRSPGDRDPPTPWRGAGGADTLQPVARAGTVAAMARGLVDLVA